MANVKIVCMDESEHATNALNYYLDNVHKEGTQLFILHCQEYWRDVAPMEGPSPARLAEMIQETKAKTESLKANVKAKLAERNVVGEFVALEDKHPWKAITDFAEARGANLIVMGCRGLGKIRRTLLGSTSDSVLHHAHCPVLISKH